VVPVKEITAVVNASLSKALIGALIGFALLVLVIIYIVNLVTRPIKSATLALQTLSTGDISDNTRLVQKSNDEIGEMASAVNRLIVA
jgi:signal transduction histidine kinase